MKSKMNIKSIIIMSLILVMSASIFFINMSLAANDKAKIIVETAKLREEASADSKTLELLSQNDEVEVLEKSGEWYKVKYKNVTGYLRQDLLKVNNEVQNSDTYTAVNTANTTNTLANTSSSSATENTISGNETTENTKSEVQENNNEEPEMEQANSEPVEEIATGKYKVNDVTNLKIVPLINASNLTEMKKDEEVNVVEVINNWARVETQNLNGWVRYEKLGKVNEETKEVSNEPIQGTKETTKTAYVSSNSVNVRKEKNTTSEVLLKITKNTAVEVLSESGGWSNVEVNGKTGYIATQYLSNKKQETTSRSTEEIRKAKEEQEKAEEKAKQEQQTASRATKANTSTNNAAANQENSTPVVSSNSGKGSDVVAYAKQYIGSKYVYGGASPSGFDCSGFTSYVYKHFGVSLNRTAAAQYSNGTTVARANLQPGDLIMFGKSGINHVGIYIGGGSIVHAANPSKGVRIDTINSGYYNTNYVGARRIF